MSALTWLRTLPRPAGTLAVEFAQRRNSLHFIRLSLALMVLLSHSFVLGGFNDGEDPTWVWTRGQDSLGGVAVAGFFVLSGFLVTRSWFSSPTTTRYLWRRCVRILPAFWLCLILTAAVFAPLAWSHERGGVGGVFDLAHDSPLQYVASNFWLHIHQWNIGDLLSATPYGKSALGAWDGSLWTLIYEFKCYLLVAILGAAGLLRTRAVVLALACALYVAALSWLISPAFAPKLLPVFGDVYVARLGTLFLLGVVFAVYSDKIVISDGLGILAVGVVLVSLREGGWVLLGYPALPYALVWLALRLPLASFAKLGDWSYGAYIYAFPIQMLLADYHVNRFGFATYTLVSILLTCVAGALSWHLFEKHALRLKNWSPRIPRRPHVREEHLLRTVPPAGAALTRPAIR